MAAWLDRPLRDITGDDVIARHAEIAAEVKAGGRYSGEATADGVMRGFRAVYNYAAEHDPSLPASQQGG